MKVQTRNKANKTTKVQTNLILNYTRRQKLRAETGRELRKKKKVSPREVSKCIDLPFYCKNVI